MYRHGICGVAVRRRMDGPYAERQPDGRPFQQRERIVHAGNGTEDQRLFRESPHSFLLQ